MNFIIKNKEIKRLKEIIGRQKRSPKQVNKLNEADAEIIKLKEQYLITTTDMISDEIHWGLYKDPFLIGWMSVVVSLSDLAASGGVPLGCLLGTHWGKEFTKKQKQLIYRGASKALKWHKTFLLGGDSSSGAETVISSTILGVSRKSMKPKKRVKIKSGDTVFAMGSFGNGPALSLRVLLGCENKIFPEKLFRPKVNFLKLNNLVSASIDVSDGLASSLCILSQLNKVNFDIDLPDDLFTEESKKFCKRVNLPLSSLFFAEHGDYQLLLVVKSKKSKLFKKNYPNAKAIAVAKSNKSPNRIKNLDKEFESIELDLLYNAEKNNLIELKEAFHRWKKVAIKLKLP